MLFARLAALFEAEGFSVRSSISPFMLKSLDPAPERDGLLTHLLRADADWRVAAGAPSLSEIYLIEALARATAPARIFVHGIGAAWTPVALALAFPDAKISAIGGSAAATALLGQLAAKHRLAVSVGKPDGIADLIFVDSAPSDIAQAAAFEAARAYCGPETLVLFQGVAVRGTGASFEAIAASLPAHRASILTRTSSGLGALVPKDAPPALVRALAGLIDPMFTGAPGRAAPSGPAG
jgi:hypothetical protein